MSELTPTRALKPAALLLLAAALVGCGARRGPPVTRVLHGEPVAGVFVSPYSYEHYLRGEMASARGDHAEAAREFAMARLGGTDDAYLAARQAESLEAAGDPARADAILAEAHALDPSSEAAWSAEGRIRESRENITGAGQAYTRATEVAPRSAEAALALAGLWMRADAPGRARAALSAFLRRSPNSRAIRVRLRLALASGALDEALTLASALERQRLSRAELRALVQHALDAQRPAAAARLAARLTPTEDAPLIMRALLAAGRRADARSLLQSEAPEAFGGTLPWVRLMVEIEDSARAREATMETLTLAEVGPLRVRSELDAGDVAAALDTLEGMLGASAEARPLLENGLRRAGLPALAAELEHTSRVPDAQ